MAIQEGAVAVWFGRGRQHDARFLQDWRSAPLTYSPEQDLDENWHVDRYETILGVDPGGTLFQRAAQLTLHNHFYPPEVMTTVSDFNLVGRPVQAGDRIVQRIRVFQYHDLPILELLSMNEITQVTDEPRRAGFTYITTSASSEVGEWSPTVEWRGNGEVALVIGVVSRPSPGASPLARLLTRRLQLRGHQLSIQNFLALLSGRPPRPAAKARPSRATQWLPWAVLGGALAVVLSVILGRQKEK